MSREFSTETEMCKAFINAIPSHEWVAYAESGGYDLVLVRKHDGFQIGIEAKLRANLEVVNQAIEQYGSYCATDPGPDCRAVLVPDGGGAIETIARYIGFTVIRMHTYHPYERGPRFTPDLPQINPAYISMWGEDWHEWCPVKRLKLPEYVPDVAAGAKSPIKLTDWKIRAIKLAVTLEKNGSLTREDFKTLGVDHRRWVAPGAGWLMVRAGRFVRGPYFPDFKTQHPISYAEIEADWDKWAPAAKAARKQKSFFE